MSSSKAIWAEHPFQLYSALQFKKYLDSKSLSTKPITLFTNKVNIKLIESSSDFSDFRIVEIEDYHKSWHTYLRLILEAILVPKDFSSVYQYNSGLKDSWWIFFKIQKHIAKHSNLNKINKRVAKVFQILNNIICPIKHKYSLIYCFTKVYYVGALHRVGTRHISIMESWDHPMKFPYFFDPEYSYVWNFNLRIDEHKFQGISNHKQIKPLKFDYINTYKKLTLEEIFSLLKKTEYSSEVNRLKDKNFILYPTTTSSNGLEHEGEVELIKLLANDLLKFGIEVYIKPKPNGNTGDYDDLKAKNLLIGKYSTDSISSDMLKWDYHMFRYFLIRRSLCTINVGTTFGLEVAYAGAPLIQLKLEGTRFGGFKEFVQTYHLERYVLSLNNVLKYSGEGFESDDFYNLKKKFNVSKELAMWISSWESN